MFLPITVWYSVGIVNRGGSHGVVQIVGNAAEGIFEMTAVCFLCHLCVLALAMLHVQRLERSLPLRELILACLDSPVRAAGWRWYRLVRRVAACDQLDRLGASCLHQGFD